MIDPADNRAIVGAGRAAAARARWQRRSAVVAVAAAVLGLHVGALQGWPVAPRVDAGASAAATAPATLEVRAMRAPSDTPAVAVPAVAAALPAVAERPVPR
ncbi:hypothetical protein MOJ79_18105, partial [Calidifontimicrobium sp. SYSU G02091]|nr:hypothetical protein [Calidifontimicrobium sp. SYSU G02091]